MFNKKLKERIELLEYENSILLYKIREIEKQLKYPILPMQPFSRKIREGEARPLGYENLKRKYRR